MKISFENPGAIFYFNEDDPDDGHMVIRIMTPGIRNDFRKQCMTKKVEYKGGKRFAFDEFDDDLFDTLMWDYVIVSWTGLEDDDGNPIECTNENKVRLMNSNISFASFVAERLTRLDRDASEFRDFKEKN